MAFRSISTLASIRGLFNALDLRFRTKKFRIALVLIAIGVIGRMLLLSLKLANIETVLVASLLAGTFLGGLYAVFVPVTILVSTDVVIYLAGYSGFYPLQDVAALALFVYSGFTLVSLIGITMRRRLVFRLRSIAILTSISIPATILYDLWTATGMWLTILGKPPSNLPLLEVYRLQVPFTCIHLFSSLIFVPLFGTIFMYYLSQPVDTASEMAAPADSP